MRRGKEDPEFQQDAQESSLEANFWNDSSETYHLHLWEKHLF